MSNGVLLFAKNNEKINYVKQSVACALMVKHYLNVPVCLVTVKSEYEELPIKLRKKAFDEVIYESAVDSTKEQKRWFILPDGKKEELTYYNSLRPNVYDLTPFDETIMLDTDYLVQNDILNMAWGSEELILMNNSSNHIVLSQKLPEKEIRLSTFGPKMYWATVVYFKKCDKVHAFFEFVKYIQKNWSFYKFGYNLSGKLYRNDYSFTIAAHTLNEWQEDGIAFLPEPLLNSYPEDKVIKITEGNILINSSIPVKVSGMNVHIMNKYSLQEHLDDIIKIYG